MSSFFLPGECGMCGKANGENDKEGVTIKLKRCGSCECVQYCDFKCQRSHWAFHQNSCKLLKMASKSPELFGQTPDECIKKSKSDENIDIAITANLHSFKLDVATSDK